MPLYINTQGKTSVAVGICDRCKLKFALVDLHPDRNSPGLSVDAACNDRYDPYRLPSRRAENITLQRPRPDEHITP